MRRYLQILMGNLLIATAYAFLVVPRQIVEGIAEGLWRLVGLPVYGWLAVAIVVGLAVCFFFLGKRCFLDSLFCCVTCLAMLAGFSLLDWTPALPAMALAALSGLMIGGGMGLCLRAGATTAGTDALALWIRKGLPQVDVAVILFGLNSLVVLLGAALVGMWGLLPGLCFAAVQALVLGVVLRLPARWVPDFRDEAQRANGAAAKVCREVPVQYTTILFDLDGTLTDPGLGITNSILYAMQQEKMALPPRQELYQFIGPPLVEAFQSVFGVSEPQALRMLTNFRVYFEKQGIYENVKYQGIDEMLRRLRDAGCRLVLATSKPEHFASMVLDYFELSSYFEMICGADLDETRSAKHAVVAYALERLGNPDCQQVIMIGDRSHDVAGGKRNGVATMGVLYGYGSRAELEGAGADMLAASVEDVANLLLAPADADNMAQ